MSSALTSGRLLLELDDLLPEDAGEPGLVGLRLAGDSLLPEPEGGVESGRDDGDDFVGDGDIPGMVPESRRLTTDRILIPMSSSLWELAVCSPAASSLLVELVTCSAVLAGTWSLCGLSAVGSSTPAVSAV